MIVYKQHSLHYRLSLPVQANINGMTSKTSFNVDLTHDNANSKCMWDFNERNQLVFSQLHINAKYTYTYSDVRNNK